MRGQRSLSAARDRDHRARERARRGRPAHGRCRGRRRARARHDDETAMREEGGDAMADDSRSRLGRGLAALMGDVVVEPRTVEAPRQPRRIPIEYVKANPRNPRRNFADAELDELAASIKERGIIQPIVVRAIGEAKDRYEIIAGERRWRAAQRAGLHEIPIVALE